LHSDGQDADSRLEGSDSDTPHDKDLRGKGRGKGGQAGSGHGTEKDNRFLLGGLKGVIAASILFSVLSLTVISFANSAALNSVLPSLMAALFVYLGAVAALSFSLRLACLASTWLALCFLWSFGILAIARIDLVPETLAAVFAVNAVNALVIGHMVYGVTVELWRDMSVDAAIRKGLKRWATPGAVAVAALLASILVLAPLEPVWISTLFVTGMGAIAASAPIIFLGLPISLRQMSFDESSVALANRHRERREDVLSHLATLASPRWAYAVFGIFVVLSAILISEGGRAADLRDVTAILL
jgi:hypothetical protein